MTPLLLANTGRVSEMTGDTPRMWDRLPSPPLPGGHAPCACPKRDPTRPLRLVVLTGGPGAGKSAVLAAARAIYCEHVAAIPEAATVLFGGGFPRHATVAGRAAAQRAIYHVQREGERLVEDELHAHSALCDRGTIDGEAYWPGEPWEYWAAVASTREQQLARYSLVVHMRTPAIDGGYDHANQLRIEDARAARLIDERILAAWAEHPNRVVIEPSDHFEDKLEAALAAIRSVVPVPGL